MSKTVKAIDVHSHLVQCLVGNEFTVKPLYVLQLACCIEYRFEYDCSGKSRVFRPTELSYCKELLRTDSLELYTLIAKRLRRLSNVQLLEYLRMRKLVASQKEVETLAVNKCSSREIVLKVSSKLTGTSFIETTETALLSN